MLQAVLARRRSGEAEARWETSDFHCQEVAPGTYLLTYDLRQGDRLTRRSTLWRRVDGAWQIVYHQGTVVTD